MHKACRELLFLVLGMILALLFLLVCVCGKQDSNPTPIPVQPPSTGQEPVSPPVVPTPPSEPTPPANETDDVRTYTVVCGDTLYDLSGVFYGDPENWRVIWKANKDVVEKPHLIYPGEVLRIPSA